MGYVTIAMGYYPLVSFLTIMFHSNPFQTIRNMSRNVSNDVGPRCVIENQWSCVTAQTASVVLQCPGLRAVENKAFP